MKVCNPSCVPAAKPFSDALVPCKPRTSASAASSTRRPAPASARGPPAGVPRKPGRKPGPDAAPTAGRQPPSPEQIEKGPGAPCPPACPGGGGGARQLKGVRPEEVRDDGSRGPVPADGARRAGDGGHPAEGRAVPAP